MFFTLEVLQSDSTEHYVHLSVQWLLMYIMQTMILVLIILLLLEAFCVTEAMLLPYNLHKV